MRTILDIPENLLRPLVDAGGRLEPEPVNDSVQMVVGSRRGLLATRHEMEDRDWESIIEQRVRTFLEHKT